MLTESANRLNIKLISLDSEGAPAKQINAHPDHVTGSFRDPQAVCQLADQCDVLTVEIEHVDTYALENLDASIQTVGGDESKAHSKVDIQPSWKTIRLIQDKYTQKKHLLRHNIATAHSIPIDENDLEGVENSFAELGAPIMLKSRTEAYDGRGNYPVKNVGDASSALKALKDRPLYAEQWANFSKELAVMVVKVRGGVNESWQDSTLAFPVVETMHEDSLCKLVYAPAREVSVSTMQGAQELARRTVATFEGKGVFGVEMFLLQNGKPPQTS